MFITPTDSLLSDEVFTSFVSVFSDMTDLQFVWGGRCQHSACRCWEEACIRILVQTPPSAAGPGHALPPAPQSAERWHLHRKHTKEDISLQTAALTALQNYMLDPHHLPGHSSIIMQLELENCKLRSYQTVAAARTLAPVSSRLHRVRLRRSPAPGGRVGHINTCCFNG